MTNSLHRLLQPRSIAVVGASPNTDKHPGRALANLVRTGFVGDLYGVNPRYDEVLGVPCVARVEDLPEGVDTVYVLVRAELVVETVRSCAARGVGGVVVCTSGFAEEGEEGRRMQDELTAVARSTGMRIVGPNCIGLVNIPDNVVATPTFNLTHEVVPGVVSVVSQSGGMAVNAVNRAQGRGVGIRHMASIGNECDVTLGDFVDALVDDDRTEVIALFIEQVRDVPGFLAALRRARDTGKHVLALKVGASQAASRSSLSHTGAMTGSQEVFTSVMTELGVLCVDTLDELVDCAAVLASGRPVGTGRLMVVSPSGGECSYAADRAEAAGLVVDDVSEQTRTALSAVMRFGTPGNPLDLTGQVIGDRELLRQVTTILEQDDDFDVLLVALATWGEHDASRLIPIIVEAAEASSKLTLISAWDARNMTEAGEAILAGARVPTFVSTDAALRALGRLAAATPVRAADPVLPEPLPAPAGDLSNEFLAKQFLVDAGIRVPRETIAATREEVLGALDGIGFPVVLKQLCTGVVHKSDLGLVAVGIDSKEAAEQAVTRFEASVSEHGLAPEGILVAEQVSGLELIVGGVRDPGFGPMLMVGAGGVLTELLGDHALARCPLDRKAAQRLIDRLAISSLLTGYRGTSYDVDALVDLVVAASDLFAASPWLSEFDLNPVLVGPPGAGACAVDAVLTVQS